MRACCNNAASTDSSDRPRSASIWTPLARVSQHSLQLLDIPRGCDRGDARERDPGDVGREQRVLPAKEVPVGDHERAGVEDDGQQHSRGERQPGSRAAAQG